MYIGNNCKIGKGEYNPLTIIGDKCIIKDGAQVERSIIWGKVKAGSNVIIRNSVIGKGCIIQSDSVLDGVVLGDKTKVTPHSRLGRK